VSPQSHISIAAQKQEKTMAVAAAAPAAVSDDRIKMECDKCGYKCVPQWLNDKAHCLKCQAVLRTRGSIHEAKREAFGAEANGEGRRVSGEASTFKLAPSSAMESASGTCSKSPNGVHHWKYGKCNFCQQAEGKLAKGPGVTSNPGGAAECDKGGKCMFKFAKCTKCGRGESGMKVEREEVRRISDVSTASSGTNASNPPRQPRPQSPQLAAAAGLLLKDPKPEEEVTKKMSKDSSDSRTTSKGEARKTSKGSNEDRTRMQCHVCGYKSIPQWLNDKAHCLKCDAVLKTRASIHGATDETKGAKDLAYKEPPGSAMESASGTCSKAPDGLHHWKYGKCNFCQQSEGKLIKGAGTLANPGGAAGCSKGGKCMFKFSKCTKCGRKEF